MKSKTTKDTTSIIIGTLIFVLISWKIIGFILPDLEKYVSGQDLLEDVMKVHGGLNDWRSKSNIDFTKEFALYTESSTIEIERKETHKYTYGTAQKRSILWREGSNSFALHKINDSIYQEKNGLIDTTKTKNQLLNKLNAAEFVLNLPFSLSDTNADISYGGVKNFLEKSCQVLMVKFKDSSDVWWLYFDQKNLSWVGYWVQTSDHYSLIVNEEMIQVNGFTLSRKRKSYRTDENQKILYLRATYLYSNYVID